jgi:hypothetical protein
MHMAAVGAQRVGAVQPTRPQTSAAQILSGRPPGGAAIPRYAAASAAATATAYGLRKQPKSHAARCLNAQIGSIDGYGPAGPRSPSRATDLQGQIGNARSHSLSAASAFFAERLRHQAGGAVACGCDAGVFGTCYRNGTAVAASRTRAAYAGARYNRNIEDIAARAASAAVPIVVVMRFVAFAAIAVREYARPVGCR